MNTHPLQLCRECGGVLCSYHFPQQMHACSRQRMQLRKTTLDIILSVADDAADQLTNGEINRLLRQQTPILLRCTECDHLGRLDQVTRGAAACGHRWASYQLDPAYLQP